MSGKSLLVLILFLSAALVGGYFLLLADPAFDLATFRESLKKTEKQMKAFSHLANPDQMPGWLRRKVSYYQDQARIIEDNLPDCLAVSLALDTRAREFRQEMQSLDQQALIRDTLQGGRQQQTRLAATIFVVTSRWAHKLLPLIEEYCQRCPAESEVFNRVLSF